MKKLLKTLLGLDWGHYTPILTKITNVDSTTASKSPYIRVGAIAFVITRFSIKPINLGATQVDISLPIVSDLAESLDVTGIGTATDTVMETGFLNADTVNERATFQFVAATTAVHGMGCVFGYRVR